MPFLAAAAATEHPSASGRAFPLWAALFGVVLLALLDGLARLTFWGRHRLEDGWLRWFNAAAEGTVPSLVAALTMAGVGLVCLSRRGAPRRRWLLMGVFFVYLGIDDLCGLHERFGALLHPALGGHGVYVWAFTLAPVFALCGALCAWRLWNELTPGARRLLVLGFGALGVAIAFEVVEDRVAASAVQLRGIPLLAYTHWLEEALELLGPVLLLAAVWAPTAPALAPEPTFARAREPVRFLGAGR